MDKIKESFDNVKNDMSTIHSEINTLREEFEKIRNEMVELCQILSKINDKVDKDASSLSPTTPTQNPTTPTHTSTHNLPPESLSNQNMAISTGNEGVPTDKQTNRQTNRQQQISFSDEECEGNFNPSDIKDSPFRDSPHSIDDAAKILDSLDSIKKEIRLKFKRLTDQEILVFSTLYQIEENTGPTDYKTIAEKLNLTESSIRDYVGRLIKKGIPVDKKRINNKNISLSISKNLKKIASLSTILKLRDI